MERLLMLEMRAAGCSAQARLNDVPVALAEAASGGSGALPVHEYVARGPNRVSLWIDPPAPGAEAQPAQRTADGSASAVLRMALLRAGQSMSSPGVQLLASLSWAPAQGDRYEVPLRLDKDIELPVNFPRWRFMDAPVVERTPELCAKAARLVARIADEFQQGRADTYRSTARLRFEELAAAYQREPSAEAARFAQHLAALAQAGSVVIEAPGPKDLVLEPCANGRLLECLRPDGLPALRAAPAGALAAAQWPLRLAAVEGELYVLR